MLTGRIAEEKDMADVETRTKRLRSMLCSDRKVMLMEAHNGLSAKLAAEAGFEALWGSSLAISAAMGVRDSNEASWTQVLEVLEFIADATDLPVLLDGDTGYGNFNNVRRLVAKLEQRGIAGLCLEDKEFPKTNSFIDSDHQALAEVDEFCGRLRAAKDTQRDPDFVVVARTEAFVAGWGLDEAVLRATAYAESGADMILVHSKRFDSQDILAFMERWSKRVPVIIIPTTYPDVKIEVFLDAGVSNFIFANQSIRTIITALQRNLALLHDRADLMSIEREIAPVSEVFRLQNVEELERSQARYSPSMRTGKVSALILAASQGDFGDLVRDKPKAMLRLHGRPILSWHAESFRRQGIRRIGAVRGHCKDAVDLSDFTYFDNDDYPSTGELISLYTARAFLEGSVVIAYGDIVCDEFILKNLLSEEADISIAVDAGWKLRNRTDSKRDLVRTAGGYGPLGGGKCRLEAIGHEVRPEEASGEWIGLLYVGATKIGDVVRMLDQWAATQPEEFRTADVPGLLSRLITAGENIAVVHTYGHWYDLDEHKDLIAASALVQD